MRKIDITLKTMTYNKDRKQQLMAIMNQYVKLLHHIDDLKPIESNYVKLVK